MFVIDRVGRRSVVCMRRVWKGAKDIWPGLKKGVNTTLRIICVYLGPVWLMVQILTWMAKVVF